MDPYLIVVLFLTFAIGILACIVGCEFWELQNERTFRPVDEPS